MRTGNARRIGRVAAYALAAFALIAIGYVVAGLVGGAIASNADWRPPERGVTIWIETNGVHTGIVVPKVAAGVDWRPFARPEHLADPRYAHHDHLSFGWGERDFYVRTPTWWDVRPTTVARAAFGSDRVLLHVDHVPQPRDTDDVRRVVLRPHEYRRLAAYIRASAVPDGERIRGYGPYDAFYGARGHYSAFTTCNAWTGNALRYAGVRVGAWTPFTFTVMRWF